MALSNTYREIAGSVAYKVLAGVIFSFVKIVLFAELLSSEDIVEFSGYKVEISCQCNICQVK